MTFDEFKDFNYVYLSGKINIDYIPKRSIFFSIIKAKAKAVYFLYLSIIASIKERKPFTCKNKIVFYSVSQNNHLSVLPVFQKLDSSSTNIFGDRHFNSRINIFLPITISAFLAAFFYPKVLVNYLLLDKTLRLNYRRGINDIVLTYPFYYVSKLWMKTVKPKAVVISNDHVYSTRILVHWANQLNIPTFYIQHAAVTKDFPKLEMKFAFLEGEDSKEKYLEAGSDSSKIELIGIPKMDYLYNKINKNKNVNVVGVAGNGLESKGDVIDVLNKLSASYPDLKITYRPHRMQFHEKQYKSILDEILTQIPKSIVISNPFKESATDYLTKIDLLVAGDSSIHLEATLLNVTSVYYFKTNDYYDYYSFLKNEMIELANNFTELSHIINREKGNRSYVRKKAKKYCSTLDTEFDGKSADLAANLLLKKLKNTY
ncbi:MAG: hypothetical protein AB7O73_03455 [Bacteroidia bacterium]